MSQTIGESVDRENRVDSRSARPARGITLLLGLLVAFLLLSLVAGGIYWRYFLQPQLEAQEAVNVEVARIQAAGEPITAADMVAFHQAPPGTEDITHLWLDAIGSARGQFGKQLPYVGTGKVELLDPNVPNSILRQAEAYLADYDGAIAAARRAAAANGECRYPVDFRQGLSAAPTINEARQLARLLALRAHVAVIRGNSHEAIESIELLSALARSLDHEPPMVSQLVRLAVLGMVNGQIEAMLRSCNLTDEQLRRLQTMLEDASFQEPMKLALFGERAAGYHAFLQMSASGPSPPALPSTQVALRHAIDCEDYLSVMQNMLMAADLSTADAWRRADAIGRNFSAGAGPRIPVRSSGGALVAQSLPAVQQLFVAAARSEAEFDCTIAAIAFRRFQLAHGRSPASLAEMVPEFLPAVPRDPFSGGPMKFIVTDAVFAIYTVGPNRIDDRSLLTDPDPLHDYGIVAPLALPADRPKPADNPDPN